MPAKRGQNGEFRQRVYQIICREPGTFKSELARRLGVTTTTIAHHVGTLEDLGLVRSVRIGRVCHLVPRGLPRSEAADLLLAPDARLVMDRMEKGGLHSPSQLRRSLGLGEKTVRAILRRLERSGLVMSDGAYHPRFWAPAAQFFGRRGPRDGKTAGTAHERADRIRRRPQATGRPAPRGLWVGEARSEPA